MTEERVETVEMMNSEKNMNHDELPSQEQRPQEQVAAAENLSSSHVTGEQALPAEEDTLEVDCTGLSGVPADDGQQADSEPLEGVAFAEVMSGSFDAEVAKEVEQPFPRRVLPPRPDTPKLHKVLAQTGLGSRLEMEQMIADGKITVNEEAAHVGQRVQAGDRVRIGGKLLRLNLRPPKPRVLAYHKPAGELVTHDDPKNRPTVFRRLPRLQLGKWQSVGRLDLNTEGLLLFTNSGDLANRLMHPSFGLEREYAVRVLGRLTDEARQQLLDGVQLEDGMAQLLRIEDGQATEGANHWYRVVIGEGRNREVRRLFEAVGHVVSRLIRIRYGAMLLPRGLKRGYYVELDEQDINALTEMAGINLEELEPPKLRQRRTRSGRSSGSSGSSAGGRRPAAKSGSRAGQRSRGSAGRKNAEGSSGGSATGASAESRGQTRNQRGRNRKAGESRPSRQQNQQKTQQQSQAQQNRQSRRSGNREKNEELPDFNLAGVSHESGVVKALRHAARNKGRKGTGGGEPDPMRTSYGYIGGDSYERQNANKGKAGGRSSGRGGRRSR